MLKSNQEVCRRMKRIIDESEKYIVFLQFSKCEYSRRVLLTRLRFNVMELSSLCRKLSYQKSQVRNDKEENSGSSQRQREFTLEELSGYTGRNGNPAYVAVDNIVYDVTNNAAWAAASHFGLTAGRDLTGEFASCHAGQSVLNKLKAVGKLI